jgi:hypothetical protein
MSLTFLTDQMVKHHVQIRGRSAYRTTSGNKQQYQPRSLAEPTALGTTNRDGAISRSPDSATNQHGKHYRQHAGPDELGSTTATTAR